MTGLIKAAFRPGLTRLQHVLIDVDRLLDSFLFFSGAHFNTRQCQGLPLNRPDIPGENPNRKQRIGDDGAACSELKNALGAEKAEISPSGVVAASQHREKVGGRRTEGLVI
jgi:hypothetical protein